MKLKSQITVLFLIVFNSLSFSQNPQISFFNDTNIKIINFSLDNDPNNLPLLTFTILNNSRKEIIFTKLLLNLNYFKKHPTSSSSNNKIESKELKPIGYWDLNIPAEENTYLYKPKYPILISSKDAQTIQIRIFYSLKGKYYVPSQIGLFKFNLMFMTYDNKAIKSNEITL